ncbi:hypothetical protein BC826DRAFT_302117 [Russula brevipes]|nr:hypothetical protein BC826DRAFT_302117 [Russula brevipes]
MASASPSSTRLSRSTSDLSSGVGASPSRIDGDKDSFPRTTIRALDQFLKFGRKGKGESSQDGHEFPPRSWLVSPEAVESAPVAPNTAAHAVPPRDVSSTSSPPLAPQPQLQLPSGSGPHRPTPEIAPTTLHHRTTETETGSGPSPATGIALAPSDMSPTLERHGSSFSGPETLSGKDASTPEPLTLARRIQALLGPQTARHGPTPSTTDVTTPSGAAQSETAGPATPGRPGPVPNTDSRLLAMLGNVNLMGPSPDGGRRSVFTILDRLRRPSAPAADAPAGSAPSSVPEDEQGDEGDNGIMLYGPLVPSKDARVEIAASDVTSVFDDGETLHVGQPARPLSFNEAGEQLPSRSPLPARSPAQQEGPANVSQRVGQKEPGALGRFDTLKGKVIEGGKFVSDKVAGGTKTWKDKMPGGRKVVKTETRWVPSPDKISLQATWWGYRLYLPPPVLDVLNDKRLKAAKRAAVITTALQWLLARVPLRIVPVQFRGGVLIARRLVPYIGYIGSFVAWSWGAITSYDKGTRNCEARFPSLGN